MKNILRSFIILPLLSLVTAALSPAPLALAGARRVATAAADPSSYASVFSDLSAVGSPSPLGPDSKAVLFSSVGGISSGTLVGNTAYCASGRPPSVTTTTQVGLSALRSFASVIAGLAVSTPDAAKHFACTYVSAVDSTPAGRDARAATAAAAYQLVITVSSLAGQSQLAATLEGGVVATENSTDTDTSAAALRAAAAVVSQAIADAQTYVAAAAAASLTISMEVAIYNSLLADATTAVQFVDNPHVVTTTCYVDPGATGYFSKVVSTNMLDSETCANYGQSTVKTQPVTSILAPAYLTATGGFNKVTLGWPSVTGAAGYLVLASTAPVSFTPTPGSSYPFSFASVDGASTYVACNTTGQSVTACVHLGLSPGVNYYYKVFAYDSMNTYSLGTPATTSATPTSTSFSYIQGFNNTTFASAKDPATSKIYVGGAFTAFGATSLGYLARLNTDGSVDTSFNPGGSGFDGTVYTMVMDSTYLYVAGDFSHYNGSITANRLVRFSLSDGSLDQAYAENVTAATVLNGEVRALSLDPSSGKVVAGGRFTNSIVRFNQNGSLDNSFNAVDSSTNQGLDGNVFALSIDADGLVYVGGDFSSYNSLSCNEIARLTSTGALDESFNPGSGLDGTAVYSLALDSTNSKLYVGGTFTSFNGATVKNLARLNLDGTLDATVGAKVPTSSVLSMSLSSPYLYIGGPFTKYDATSVAPGIVRLNLSNLSKDTSFTAGFLSPDVVRSIIVDGTGVYAFGDISSYLSAGATYSRPRFARLLSTGALDLTYASLTGLNGAVTAIYPDAAGAVYVAGNSKTLDGTVINGPILKLNAGTRALDSGFTTISSVNPTLNAIMPAPNGKLYVAGSFTSFGGIARKNVARIDATSGAIDLSFSPPTSGFNSTVMALATDANGKLLCGGLFTSYGGVTHKFITRLNSDGSADPSFQAGLAGSNSPNNYVYSIQVDGDGKIYLAGKFSLFGSMSVAGVVRLNPDGSLDTSWIPPMTGGIVKAVLIDPSGNGKLYIGGAFTSIDGVQANYIARLNSDGSLDTTFDSTVGFDVTVNSLAASPTGQVIAAGFFSTYRGQSFVSVAALLPDGSPDPTFLPNLALNNWMGFSGGVNAITVDSAGKIFAGTNSFSKFTFPTGASAMVGSIMKLDPFGNPE